MMQTGWDQVCIVSLLTLSMNLPLDVYIARQKIAFFNMKAYFKQSYIVHVSSLFRLCKITILV